MNCRHLKARRPLLQSRHGWRAATVLRTKSKAALGIGVLVLVGGAVLMGGNVEVARPIAVVKPVAVEPPAPAENPDAPAAVKPGSGPPGLEAWPSDLKAAP